MFYPIAISMGDDEQAWGVEVPDVPGCFSAGEDLEDAIAMVQQAIEGHFEMLAVDGAPFPSASSVALHAANPKYAGCTWALVEIADDVGSRSALPPSPVRSYLLRMDPTTRIKKP